MKKLPEKLLNILIKYGVAILDCNEIILNSGIIGRFVELPTDDSIKKFCRSDQEMRQEIQRCRGLGKNVWSQGTSAMSFGQHEKLIPRLEKILSSYPQDDSVLKEMIQNADDAGATEIHFLLDMRTHKTEKTFEEEWNPLQGPALCVYNDGIFNDSDLEGLQRLGSGSKGDDRTKTGQFGIGFNSVYHLTDAPCILAHGPKTAMGGFFCVFDPHCRYAPLAHYGNPGMVMECNELKTNHPDVFDTFLSTEELKRKYGTWFRFPLRSLEHIKSQISSKTYSLKDMLSLLDKMKENVQENLLFLLNLKKITISSVNTNTVHTIVSETEAVCNNDTIQKQTLLKDQLKRLDEKLRNSPLSVLKANLSEYKYTYSMKVNGKITSQWLVVHSLGLTQPNCVDVGIGNAFKNKQIKFLPKGGVAVLLNGDLDCSKAFCLLPLPVETGFPCHINGQFAVDTSRHRLWGSDQSSNINDIRGKWNIELLKRNISYAYASAIFNSRDHCNERRFYQLFPLFEQAENNLWRYLAFHVYLQIKKRSLEVFRSSARKNADNVSWVANRSTNGNSLLVDTLYQQRSTFHVLQGIFLNLGMKLIELPSKIQRNMSKACQTFNDSHERNSPDCICIKSIDPSSAVFFFSSQGVHCVKCLSGIPSLVKLCVEYCLQVPNVKELVGLPLLLRNDGSIICFKMENDLILSEFSDLLPMCADRFVHSALTNILDSTGLTFKKLTGSLFNQLLPMFISESEYKTNSAIQIGKDASVTIHWLERFWKFIDTTANGLEGLADWNLLPVLLNGEKTLLQIKHSHLCIDYESFTGGVHQGVIDVMRKLSLPVPIVTSERLLKSLVKYDNVSGVINCLHIFENFLSKNINNLTEDECVLFFEYLITKKQFNNTTITQLKRIPLFVSVIGQNVNLTTEYFAVKNASNAPMKSIKPLLGKLNLTALKYFPGIHYLYDLISCKVIGMAKLYIDYILPNFRLVEQRYFMHHLTYIRKELMSDLAVQTAMKEVPFLLVNGVQKKAKDFYNPFHPLFAELVSDENFPPTPYDTTDWQDFLIKAGLKNHLDEAIFLELASCTSKLSVTKETIHKSKLLIEHLNSFLSQNIRIDKQFASDISYIKFVPICPLDDCLQQICRSTVKRKALASFKEAFSYDQMFLVWTTEKVLPSWASACKTKLQLIQEPSFETVKNHIKKISTALQTSCGNHDQTLIENIMNKIYTYLVTYNERLNEIDGIPIIHIPNHQSLVYPHQVVKALERKDEIIPYLFTAPQVYGEYFDLFEAIGMQKEATIASYCKVLNELHTDVIDFPLSQSQLTRSRNAMYGFMKTLQVAEKPFDDLDVKKLYLLSETDMLLPSDILYFDSLEFPRSRLPNKKINFLADFECIGINVSQLHDMFALLPEIFRPRSIQVVVREEIYFTKSDGCKTVEKLYDMLTNNKFINALLRVCKYDQTKLRREFTIIDMRKIAAKLRRLRVVSVSHLETKLQLDGLTVEGTKIDKICFYNQEDEVLYVKSTDIDIDRWFIINYIELERYLQVISFGKCQRHTLLTVLPLFSTKYDCIETTLTQFGIPSLEEGIFDKVWYPPAGSLLPVRLKKHVRKAHHPLPAKSYVVVIINEDVEFGKGNTDDIECNSFADVNLRYGIITDIVKNLCGKASAYKINIGKHVEIEVDKDLIFELLPITNESDFVQKDEEALSEPPLLGRESADRVDGRNPLSIHPATYHYRRLPNPQIREGRVWLNQAKLDLQSGYILMEGLNKNPTQCFNWVCHQAQQAAEKATKGAQNAVDAFSFQKGHHLLANIPKKDDTLRTLASQLQFLIQHINGLRYPENLRLPADRYSENDAVEALKLAKRIVNHVEVTYFFDS